MAGSRNVGALGFAKPVRLLTGVAHPIYSMTSVTVITTAYNAGGGSATLEVSPYLSDSDTSGTAWVTHTTIAAAGIIQLTGAIARVRLTIAGGWTCESVLCTNKE